MGFVDNVVFDAVKTTIVNLFSRANCEQKFMGHAITKSYLSVLYCAFTTGHQNTEITLKERLSGFYG